MNNREHEFLPYFVPWQDDKECAIQPSHTLININRRPVNVKVYKYKLFGSLHYE